MGIAGAIISAFTNILSNGTTADANAVMALLNQISQNVNANAAENGANSSITSLTGLTTPLSVLQGGTGTTLAPVYVAPGVRADYGGFTAPAGWLIENGQAVNRTTYAALFAAITQQGTFTGSSGSNSITLGAALAYSSVVTTETHTFSGTTGTNTITLTSAITAANPAGLPISGPGIPAGTFVTAYNTSTNVATLSQNLTATETSQSCFIGNGWAISGPGIPTNTIILGYNSSTLVVTLSQNLTAAESAAAFVMSPYGVGDGSTTFNVPNSLDRVLVGAGNLYAAGTLLGSITHHLVQSELPNITLQTNGTPFNFQTGATPGIELTGSNGYTPTFLGGSDLPFNIMQPSMGSLRIIKT